MNRFLLLILLLTVCETDIKAQGLAAIEDSIAHQYSRLTTAPSDDVRRDASDKMRSWLIKSFDDPGVFTYPFDLFKFCKITSTDGQVRIFNWNHPNEDGTYHYYAFVLMQSEKNKPAIWIELKATNREPEVPDNKYMSPDKWLGALYYEIIPAERKSPGTYLLLGWDGKDDLTTRKIIEVMTINGDKVRFGAPLFETPDGTRKRYILEYSDEVSASLRYFPKKKCIVFDHLSPKSPMLKGIYAEYGPDGTYDLFQWERGKWILKENIDISRFAGDDDRPYFDPRDRR